MSRLKFNLLLLILFFIFTQGLWERLLGVGNLFPQLFLELAIIAFIVYQFKIPKSIPGKSILTLIIISGILSGSYNGNSILETFMFLRYFVYGILIYYQLYFYNLGIERWIKTFKFLIFLIILQGVGSVLNLFIVGEQVEGYVGLMSSLGGTTATSFPLLVSSILILIYFFSTKLTKSSILIISLLMISAFLVGYSSGKRAIYFVVPLFTFLVFIISILKVGTKSFFKKKLFGFSAAAVVFFPLILIGIQNSKGLNYGLSGNENSKQIIENAFSYAGEYESSTAGGLTIGRSNTTENILNKITDNSEIIFFGTGYTTLKDEAAMFKLGIGYGIVGITRDIISAGVIFALLVVIIIFLTITGGRFKIRDKFSSSLRILVFFVFLFVHFTYSSDFTVHLKLNIILFILLSLINSPVHQESYDELTRRIAITN